MYYENNFCTLFCTLLCTLISDVLDKIKTGLQYASNYLETAKDIADLVSKSLGRKQKQKHGDDENDAKQPFGPSNLVSAFFQLIGLDSQKVAAIAVNSVIFLAQMVILYAILSTSTFHIYIKFNMFLVFLLTDKFALWIKITRKYRQKYR